MSISDVSAAFVAAAGARHQLVRVTMKYSGKAQVFRFEVQGREPVDVVWDGPTKNDAIASAALAALV